MRSLKVIRVILSVVIFVASIGYLSMGGTGLVALVGELQIVPSALGATIGIAGFWLAVTLFLGRIYCSSVCPIGTLQDMVIRLRGVLPGVRKGFSFREPKRFRYDVVIIYIVCLIFGIGVGVLLLEPWTLWHNIVSLWEPDSQARIARHLGISVLSGMVGGIVSLLLIVGYALFRGRSWCNEVCPIGVALGALSSRALMHIEIDPDRCINCMKCEERCKGECIKVVSRYVDNSRCVRCFNCVAICPNDAIRYQVNRNRRVNPMMRRTGSTT